MMSRGGYVPFKHGGLGRELLNDGALASRGVPGRPLSSRVTRVARPRPLRCHPRRGCERP